MSEINGINVHIEELRKRVIRSIISILVITVFILTFHATPFEIMEVTLYYPGLYAGSTDLVCLHNGRETVVDFKQANRPKKKEWIEDYYLQIAAYAMAHDYVHKSNIEQGVIMVCTPDLYYQEFKVDGHELRRYKHKFLKRLDMYHDLIFDEKEKANVNINPEDFFNGS